jgi:copper homeostasis protein
MGNTVLLEICVDSIESALAAERGGAHRVELCSNLLEGGVTPSAGLISTTRRKLSIDIHVMIRPRSGDFCYSAEEFETMEQDVLTAKQLDANGIVFGILTNDGEVDVPRTSHLVQIARPLKTTFHRAFDMSRKLNESLMGLIEAGADRVLTSGGEQKAEDGIPTIAKLVQAANRRIAVMVGSGITESNVRRIIEETGVREIHASLRAHVPSAMQYRNEKISMGPAKGREYERVIVLEDAVRRLLDSTKDGHRRTTNARQI